MFQISLHPRLGTCVLDSWRSPIQAFFFHASARFGPSWHSHLLRPQFHIATNKCFKLFPHLQALSTFVQSRRISCQLSDGCWRNASHSGLTAAKVFSSSPRGVMCSRLTETRGPRLHARLCKKGMTWRRRAWVCSIASALTFGEFRLCARVTLAFVWGIWDRAERRFANASVNGRRQYG